jgi:hypothetical protein
LYLREVPHICLTIGFSIDRVLRDRRQEMLTAGLSLRQGNAKTKRHHDTQKRAVISVSKQAMPGAVDG